MATGIGASIVKDGLAFAYDMSSDNSWKGKPTTNFIHHQNAVAQESYTPYVQTTSGAWQTNHPDAIRAYNASGGEITGYVNTGVGDYTNTWHAIWTYDDELKKPVVTMRDADGNWKAKSFGTGKTMNSAGLAYGDTYTISYLQKVNNLSKRLRVGVYGQNTGGTNNFHDGLQGAYNTKINTWERVYHTFTVSTAWNLNAGLSIYMYGHYDARATIHIADVQWEKGIPSKFSPTETRSNTQALLDWTGNATITATSPTYNTDGSFTFNSGTERLDISNSIPINNNFSWTAWIRSNNIGQTQNIVSMNGPYFMRLSGSKVRFNILTSGGWLFQNGTTTLSSNTWYNLCMVWNGNANTWTGYINGEQEFSVSKSGTVTYSSLYGYVGYTPQGGEQSYFNGDIPVVYCHNKALTAQEVQQNFNALRGRYGI